MSITEQLDADALNREIAREFAKDAAESKRLEAEIERLRRELSREHAENARLTSE
jgi:hypothetical protein